MRWIFYPLLVAAVSTLSFNQVNNQDEEALRAMWQRFEEFFNRHDAKGIADLYSPGGDRINPQGKIARGRAEIQQQYEEIFAKREANPETQPYHAAIGIRFVRPEVALLDGEWQVDTSQGKFRGQFTVTAMKEEGHWWIAAGRDRGIIKS